MIDQEGYISQHHSACPAANRCASSGVVVFKERAWSPLESSSDKAE